MPDIHLGTCFCGAVRFEVLGEPLEMGYCHCNSCRSYSGEPFSTYILFKAQDVQITSGSEWVGHFNKAGISDRQFCRCCGGRLFTDHPGMGVIDVRPGLLPSIAFKPQVHLHYAQAVLPVQDGLPKLKDFPAAAGGSGEEVPE